MLTKTPKEQNAMRQALLCRSKAEADKYVSKNKRGVSVPTTEEDMFPFAETWSKQVLASHPYAVILEV